MGHTKDESHAGVRFNANSPDLWRVVNWRSIMRRTVSKLSPPLTGGAGGWVIAKAKIFTPAVLLAHFSISVMIGCNGARSTSPAPPAPSPAPTFTAPGSDPWKLASTSPDTTTPSLLWNGQLGVRLTPSHDVAIDEDKRPQVFLIDEYQTNSEEKIQPVDAPLSVGITTDGKYIAPANGDNYKAELDMRSGLLASTWSQGHMKVSVASVIDPFESSLSQRWTMTISPGTEFSIRSTCGSQEPLAHQHDPRDSQWHVSDSKVRARMRQWLTGVDQQDWMFTRVATRINARANSTGKVVFSRTITFGESPNRHKMIQARMPHADIDFIPLKLVPPTPPTFDEIAKRSEVALKAAPDIEIDGPIEDQQAVRSFLFYLRSAIHPEGKMSISPFALSNDLYGGHVFWDADIWVFPGLAFVNPERAKVIPEYRLARMKAAEQNAKDWYNAGRPTANREYSPSSKSKGDIFARTPNYLGMKFPWESSVSGRETAPGPSRFEEHITGSVAFSITMASSLGLIPRDSDEKVSHGAWNYYIERSERGPTSSDISIKSVMSVDENHTGDNDLYTNLVARFAGDPYWILEQGHVTAQYAKPYLPRDDKSFLTYDNDPIKSYKQAAAVLAIYPLQYPPAEAQAKVMMERFADKVIKNGPAMSDSVHATIWARLGETDKAYDTWKKGWTEFVKPPFLLFSEKRNQDRTYFTTGAAGELQTVIYGFLGFRIDSKPVVGANWSLKLKGDRWLSIKPNLPKQWKRVTFRNFHVLGKTYTLTATHESVQVTRGD